MSKGYGQSRKNKYSEVYEIVQLLRINGARIDRNSQSTYIVRLGHKGSWANQEMTTQQLKARYGHGTIGYKALRMHQRADRVPVARPRASSRNRDLAF
jgi:hypothetical protein